MHSYCVYENRFLNRHSCTMEMTYCHVGVKCCHVHMGKTTMEAEVVFCFLFLAKRTVPQCHSEGAVSVFVTLGPSAPLLSPSAV